jgi:hypothetical protein
MNTTQALPPPAPEDVHAKIRDDLIRRLFAVAISAGAAATVSQMPWVQVGRAPCLSEWQQLLILIVALIATVLSWDGYLVSISERPLRNFWRFAIDITLVFIYMFLLMTSKLLVWWLFILALIFTLYAIWDLLTVCDWLPSYYYRTDVPQTISGVYIGGLRDSPNVSRGPIITIVWGIYFWALFLLSDSAVYWFDAPGRDHFGRGSWADCVSPRQGEAFHHARKGWLGCRSSSRECCLSSIPAY